MRKNNRVNLSVLIAGDAWHPLDAVPPPEYIPPVWIGPHAGLRLVEAFKTLSRMPMGNRSAKSGIWPPYRHEWEDLLAQVNADAIVREQDARDQNRARLMPTAEDISRMERAIVWPARYLGHRPVVSRIVLRLASYRALRGNDLDYLARKLKQPADFLRRLNRNGLDEIALGLHRHREPVF